MDLNHIFLFIAIVSPLAVLASAWRPGENYRGWRIASLVVLGITGGSWLFFQDAAGFIGGGAWFALLFLPAIGLRRMADLAARHRFREARKLAALLRILHPSSELRRQVQLLRAFESGAKAPIYPIQTAFRQDRKLLRSAPAVLVFVALNLIAFLIEILNGGWSDRTLYRLGGVEQYSILFLGQYWRLLTALFLHAGPVHLLFNLFALYILGVPLEKAIGPFRFCVCYLIAGVGSTAGVVLLTRLGLTHTSLLVGASGAIMGIVGAWAGFLLLNRSAPLAKQRLNNILLIVLIQIAFDFSTPQVSMAAHMCGLFTGLVMGLILSPPARAR